MVMIATMLIMGHMMITCVEQKKNVEIGLKMEFCTANVFFPSIVILKVHGSIWVQVAR